MVESGAQQVPEAVEIMRKGGTLLGESCPRCGGLQVRYKGKTLCISESNFQQKSNIGVSTSSDTLSALKDVIIDKIQESNQLLAGERSIEKQMQLAKLLQVYVMLLKASSSTDSEVVSQTNDADVATDENTKSTNN